MTTNEAIIILGPRPPLQRGVWSREHHNWHRQYIELCGGFTEIYDSRKRKVQS